MQHDHRQKSPSNISLHRCCYGTYPLMHVIIQENHSKCYMIIQQKQLMNITIMQDNALCMSKYNMKTIAYIAIPNYEKNLQSNKIHEPT